MKEKLKLVKNLLEKRSARRKEGKFVVEGPHLVEAAGDKINFIVYCEKLAIVKKLEEAGVPAIKVSPEQFAELSGVEAPQGVLGVVRQFGYQFRDVIRGDNTLIVFCVGVQDPGNLGTIIRSADAFGASGVILSKGTVDLYNPKVVRSTMGSLFHLPIVMTEDERETLEHLRQKNVKIVATTIFARKNCSEADLTQSLALLVGNEGAGLDKELVKLADEEVKIPMAGQAESLNVGISTAVLLYEALRQHGR